MKKANQYTPSESLHRLVKQLMDAGSASSLAEAEARFLGYRVNLEVPKQVEADPVAQATLLTAVALGARVFLGGVYISGDIDCKILIPVGEAKTLGEAVQTIGGITGTSVADVPTIIIGGNPTDRRSAFCVRTTVGGWRGGIVPSHHEKMAAPGPSMPLAGMLAAALAINEAYLHVDGQHPVAGRRTVGMSLWNIATANDWLLQDDQEPTLRYLPSHLWLVGLGHLGQAYLWGLGLLPYDQPDALRLVLQDIDIITPSTLSTSVLSSSQHVGQMKTRAMADWAEERGFIASINERMFDAGFTVQSSEPPIALCGLDNALGRRALDQVGFKMVVEAGLGRGYQNFRSMRLHTLPSQRPAIHIWPNTQTSTAMAPQTAYMRLMEEGTVDQCGMTLLAGKAVGAPFVGATAATLALSEVLRHLHGGTVHGVIDLDMLCIDQRTASTHALGFGDFNPGYTPARLA